MTQNISVIGAGIMGIMGAYTLQKALRGAHITLHDPQGFPAKNASSIAGGMLAPLSELDHMPTEYLDAGFEAINIWQSISDGFEFNQNGSLIIAHPSDRHLLERFKSILPTNDSWSTVNPNKEEPLLSFKNGLIMQGEAHLHPQKTMNALLKKIKNKKTEHIEIESKNADWLIDCRGLSAQNSEPNLRGVKGETLIVYNPEFTLKRPVRLMHPRYPLYIVPREGDIFMIGATIIESADDHLTLRSGLELMSALYSLHPSFAEAQILEMNSGIRPAYPDNLPRITVDGNIIRANGLFRHGYLCAPVMAKCIESIICGKNYKYNHLFIKDKKDESTSKRHAANT